MHVSRREMLRLTGLASASLVGLSAGCGNTRDGSSGPFSFADMGADLDLSVTAPEMTLSEMGAIAEKPWWLTGNYRPVADEIDAFDLQVEGQIPSDLDGIFLRNGANPLQEDSAHWFLGDGMLHGIRFSGGKAEWYRNRFIRTTAYESQAGESLAANRANTSIIQHAGKVLALYEVGQPHEISAEDLTTIGPFDFGGALKSAMSAHPKIDPQTGEMFFIGYAPFPPYLTFHSVAADGTLTRSEVIDIPRPTMMHDMQITESYVLFFDLPIVFDLNAAGQSGFPFQWSPEAGARIGVMPRTGSNTDVQWIDIDLCYMFHSFNAFEDPTREGHIILEGCRLESLWSDNASDALIAPTPWRWDINLQTKTVAEEPIEGIGMDFPHIDFRRQGRANNIAYGLHIVDGSDDGPAHPVGVVKWNRTTGSIDRWDSGEALQPDEARFVPAAGAEGEDEGYLLSVVYDEANDQSAVVILDASRLASGPVARIHLPRRVPFGFHGAWIPNTDR